MRKTIAFFDEPTDFSLVQGGPLFQLFLRTGLLRLPTNLLARRIVVLVLIAWMPLLLLSVLSGHAVGGLGVPFLYDLGAQVRLLLCVPLFLAADVVVHRRIKVTVRQFLDRGLIAPEDQPRFEGIIASAMRLRNSALAEVLILAVAIAGGSWLGKRYVAMQVATWFAAPIGDQMQLTAAGYYYCFVSLMIFRFLLLRWYFRLFVWYRFLWQVSRRIRLRLNALHPDRSGGLAFLSGSISAFMPILLAHTIGLAGILGGKIWHEGATLPQFKLEIGVWMVFLMLLVLAPLCFFVTQLATAKRTGLREYGIVASRYVTEFRRKWIEGLSAKDESLVGTADIQSLADLSNSFEVVREMRLVPLGRATVLRLALLTALPLLPLVLTMIPIEQLIDRAIGVFL
ncbi:MAG: hypothetical protein WC869_08575 [Phycisphaerae bacterium]|jgi:hypothetical protein